jgi:phage protein U
MGIGTFGDVVFEASSRRVRTPDGIARKAEARLAEHAVCGRKPVLEYLGPGLTEVSFSMVFSAALGVDPTEELKTLRRLRDRGAAEDLIFGGVPQGRFVLASLDEEHRVVDGKGRLIVAVVQVTLKEYVDVL